MSFYDEGNGRSDFLSADFTEPSVSFADGSAHLDFTQFPFEQGFDIDSSLREFLSDLHDDHQHQTPQTIAGNNQGFEHQLLLPVVAAPITLEQQAASLLPLDDGVPVKQEPGLETNISSGIEQNGSMLQMKQEANVSSPNTEFSQSFMTLIREPVEKSHGNLEMFVFLSSTVLGSPKKKDGKQSKKKQNNAQTIIMKNKYLTVQCYNNIQAIVLDQKKQQGVRPVACSILSMKLDFQQKISLHYTNSEEQRLHVKIFSGSVVALEESIALQMGTACFSFTICDLPRYRDVPFSMCFYTYSTGELIGCVSQISMHSQYKFNTLKRKFLEGEYECDDKTLALVLRKKIKREED